MKKLILHIGPHKTATSTLQYLMNNNRKTLKKNNIYYPFSGIMGQGHHNLPWSQLADRRYDVNRGGWAELLRELKAVPPEMTIFISSEGFCKFSSYEFSAVRLLLRDYRISVMFVVRDLVSWTRSQYAEEVKNGICVAPIDIFAKHLLEYDKRVNYVAYLDQIRQVLAGDLQIFFHHDDIINNIMRFIGVAELSKYANIKNNVSLSEDKLMKILNQRKLELVTPWDVFFVTKVNPFLHGRGELGVEKDDIRNLNLSNDVVEALTRQHSDNLVELSKLKGATLHDGR